MWQTEDGGESETEERGKKETEEKKNVRKKKKKRNAEARRTRRDEQGGRGEGERGKEERGAYLLARSLWHIRKPFFSIVFALLVLENHFPHQRCQVR